MNDELEKLKGDHKLPLKEIIKRTLKYLGPEKRSFIIALIMIALHVILDSISPLIARSIMDELVLDDIRIKYILTLALLSFIITLNMQIFIYIESTVLQRCGQRIIYRLRNEIFEHIENMSLNQFNEMPVGSLVTRVTSYTESMSGLFTSVIVVILRNVATLIGSYVIMFYISKSLAIAMSGVVLLIFLISFSYN